MCSRPAAPISAAGPPVRFQPREVSKGACRASSPSRKIAADGRNSNSPALMGLDQSALATIRMLASGAMRMGSMRAHSSRMGANAVAPRPTGSSRVGIRSTSISEKRMASYSTRRINSHLSSVPPSRIITLEKRDEASQCVAHDGCRRTQASNRRRKWPLAASSNAGDGLSQRSSGQSWGSQGSVRQLAAR